jgi:hypothetical protein
MKKLIKLILLVPLIQLASCGMQDSESSTKLKSKGSIDSEISSYNSTMASSKGENGQILSAVEASEAIESGSVSGTTAVNSKLAVIDAKFQEVWDGLTAEQQEEVKNKIKGILKIVKDMPEADRKGYLRQLRPPLPSKTVLDGIVPAPTN